MGDPNKKKTPKEINAEFTRSLSMLQESLASLRVVVKYMQLDLEATKRENEVLEKDNAALLKRLAKYEGESQSKD